MKLTSILLSLVLVPAIVAGSALPLRADQAIQMRIKGLMEFNFSNSYMEKDMDPLAFRNQSAALFFNPVMSDRIKGSLAFVLDGPEKEIRIWNAYADYIFGPQFIVRYGADLTPFGRWELERTNLQRDIWVHPMVLDTGMFQDSVMGAFALGLVGTPAGDLAYRVGVTNNQDPVSPTHELGHDGVNTKTVVGRVTLATESGLQVGISGLSGAMLMNDMKDGDQTLYGTDLSYRWGRLNLVGEYIGGTVQMVAGDSYMTTGYYGQVGYMVFDNVTVAYRYDVHNDNSLVTTDTMDEGTRQVVGLSYKPDPGYNLFLDYFKQTTEAGNEVNKFVFTLGVTF